MSYRRNDSESESVSFDPGEYSTNRRHRKHRRRGSAKVKGACRGGDGKFMSCSERGARPNAASRKRKSTKKSSKRTWGGSKGGYSKGYSKSYSTKGGRKSRKSKGGYSKYESKRGRREEHPYHVASKRPGKGRGAAARHSNYKSIERDMEKVDSILRSMRKKVRDVPKSAIDEILHLMKSLLDT